MNKQEDNNQKIMRLLTADLELKDFLIKAKLNNNTITDEEIKQIVNQNAYRFLQNYLQ